jgi:hypothetical protein
MSQEMSVPPAEARTAAVRRDLRKAMASSLDASVSELDRAAASARVSALMSEYVTLERDVAIGRARRASQPVRKSAA